ncbi:MAG: serine acetyltransferase [Bacteroidales bacterium]|nr:serine acetyltransferase [Bacteroidales bacterium]
MEMFFKKLQGNNQHMSSNFPKKIMVYNFLNELTNFLFPVCKDVGLSNEKIKIEWDHLNLLLKELLIPVKEYIKQDSEEVSRRYFDQIPSIFDQLLKDAKVINDFDPAAFSKEEVVIAYPGFQAILTYRLAHPLYVLGVPVLPRLMSEYTHSKTGIDIHPGAKIGKSFFIDHGTGIVIGETTEIGNNVKIYQGVTLGALNVKKEEAKIKRHPTIEDNVIIYSGTTVLGGKTIIGHDSIVGGNVWITKSIEPYSVVHNLSEIKVRNGNERFKEPINFII